LGYYILYRFQAALWQHAGKGGWFFVSLPFDLAVEIREHLKGNEQGWGRMPVSARIGSTEWKTAIWYDTKHNTYLLPVKAPIRNAENLEAGTEVEVQLSI
jgi:hypothetical protein